MLTLILIGFVLLFLFYFLNSKSSINISTINDNFSVGHFKKIVSGASPGHVRITKSQILTI